MSRSTRCKNAGAVVASAKVKEGAEAAVYGRRGPTGASVAPEPALAVADLTT